MQAAPRVMLDTHIASWLIRSGNDALRSRLRAFLRIAVEAFLRHVDIAPGTARRPPPKARCAPCLRPEAHRWATSTR